jgi:hypothetical protein
MSATMTETLSERRAALVEERRAEQSRYDDARASLLDNPGRAADAASARERISVLDEAIATIDAQIAQEADEEAERQRQAVRDAEVQSLADLSRNAAEMFGALIVMRDELAKRLDETVRNIVTLREGLRATQRQFFDAADRMAPGFEIKEGRSRKERAPSRDLVALADAIRARGGTFDGLLINWQSPKLGSLASVVSQVSGVGYSHLDAQTALLRVAASPMALVVDSLVDVALGDLTAVEPGIEAPTLGPTSAHL